MKYYIYEANLEGVKRSLITFIEPEIVYKKGLREQTVFGELKKTARPDYQEIVPNPAFIELFQRVVAREFAKERRCINDAGKRGSGWIYFVDNRAGSRTNEADPRDIVGSYQAEDGKIIEGSYNPNPRYSLITEKGFFKLPRRLYNELLRELRRQVD